MKIIRHYATARDKLLHVEVDGCIVNITVGLTDMQGHRVTSVAIVPDDERRGGDGEGRVWRYVPGESNHRLIRLHEDEKDLPVGDVPERPVGEGDTTHTFVVTVEGCTSEQASQVMAERIGVDEDYGFDYRIDWS